jgi:hypothetical protein
MLVISQLLWALVCIHAFWLYCFVTGSLVRKKTLHPSPDQAPTHSRHHMAELVITSTTGMAITGFVLLLLGFAGLLNLMGLLMWLALEVLLFKIIKQENVFGIAFWLDRIQIIRRAWNVPTLIIYFVFLLLAVPAVLPPTAWDSIMYHLAYAVDWANAGRIHTDNFLRFPYYANNFLLIYALMFVLKLGYLCHFATWLCGLLSGLGVYVLIADDTTNRAELGRWFRLTLAFKDIILPLTLALSPVFLKYVNVGYVDVPIGLFILVPVLCTCLILNGESRNYEIDLLVTAAFLVGMKVTLILCLPLFGISLFLVLRRQQKATTHALALCALLLLLSAPWYLRNLVAAGDPIPPVLNFIVRGSDNIFTARDYLNIKADLPTLKDTSAILLPIDLFRHTDSNAFREPGANFSVVLLYLPLATLFLMVFKGFRRRVGTGFVYVNIAVIYLLVNWLGISTAARYSLHLFPVYLGYLGICFNLAFRYAQSLRPEKRVIRLVLQTSLLLLLLALPYPSPSSKKFYAATLRNNYLDLPTLKNKDSFLRTNLPGYASMQTVVNSLYANGGQHQKVLAVGFENLSFYFRERKIVSVGDWFGPGRYSDVMAATDNSGVAAYLHQFDIGAVLVDVTRNQMKEEQYQKFIKQLELSGFKLQPRAEARTDFFLKISPQEGSSQAVADGPKGTLPSSEGTKSATIVLDSNPLKVCDGSALGTATVSFTFPKGRVVEVHIDSPDGPLFTRSAANGAAPTGKWVVNGMTFFLQDVTGGKALAPENTLATASAKLTTEGCP